MARRLPYPAAVSYLFASVGATGNGWTTVNTVPCRSLTRPTHPIRGLHGPIFGGPARALHGSARPSQYITFNIQYNKGSHFNVTLFFTRAGHKTGFPIHCGTRPRYYVLCVSHKNKKWPKEKVYRLVGPCCYGPLRTARPGPLTADNTRPGPPAGSGRATGRPARADLYTLFGQGIAARLIFTQRHARVSGCSGRAHRRRVAQTCI